MKYLSELAWTTHAIMIFQMKIDLLARTAVTEKKSSSLGHCIFSLVCHKRFLRGSCSHKKLWSGAKRHGKMELKEGYNQ